MAEGHVWFEDERKLTYVYHTLRWDDKKDGFAANGRNAEDLAVEILSPDPTLDFSMPLITPNWKLDLKAGEESPCAYDWVQYRYCINVKTVIGSASSALVLVPDLTFTTKGSCKASAAVSVTVAVKAFKYADGVGAVIKTFALHATCDGSGAFSVSTPATKFDTSAAMHEPWVVATVKAGTAATTGVTMSVHYSHTGDPVIPSDGYQNWNAVMQAKNKAATA
jgi:hypothetical protein